MAEATPGTTYGGEPGTADATPGTTYGGETRNGKREYRQPKIFAVSIYKYLPLCRGSPMVSLVSPLLAVLGVASVIPELKSPKI